MSVHVDPHRGGAGDGRSSVQARERLASGDPLAADGRRPENTTRRQDQTGWWVLLGCVIYTVLMVIAGYGVHAQPCDLSPESDGFVLRARELLSGTIPTSRFHPLWYPASIAVFAEVFGVEPFEAGRWISSLWSGVALFVVYRLGVLLFGSRAVGVLASASVACSPSFWLHAWLASSDMTFLALSLLGLVLAIEARKRIAMGASRAAAVAVAAGACAGLAWSTRYVGVLWLPVVIWIAGGFSLTRVRWVVLGMFAAMLPQLIANTMVFGRPLYDENWRNLAIKVLADGDFAALYSEQVERVGGWWSLITNHPFEIMQGAIEQVVVACSQSIPQAAGGRVLGVAICLLALTGLVAAVWRWVRSPRAGAGAGMAVSGLLAGYLLLVCATFLALPRLMLPLVPAVHLLAHSALRSAVSAAAAEASGRRVAPVASAARAGGGQSVARIAAMMASVVLLLAMSATTTGAYEGFRRNHSPGVFDALDWVAEHDPGALVVGDHPWVAQYSAVRYVYESRGGGVGEPANGLEYLALLEGLVATGGVDYLLFSRRFLAGRPASLLETTPSFLRAVMRSGGAVLYAPRDR